MLLEKAVNPRDILLLRNGLVLGIKKGMKISLTLEHSQDEKRERQYLQHPLLL